MEKQEESVNLIEEKIKELIMLLQTNQHVKDKVVAQAAWDKYLKLLRKSGQPLGINTISSIIGMDKETIEGIIDPWVLSNGKIIKTSKGRVAA